MVVGGKCGKNKVINKNLRSSILIRYIVKLQCDKGYITKLDN